MTVGGWWLGNGARVTPMVEPAVGWSTDRGRGLRSGV